ncbi:MULTISPECIES: pyridoxamine 5'-phosphate oxidase family protein [unclassified Siphonobacter]|uniref:pyridoxamine 5'-phosphate oxidase family protein n=1 Tax=unclassified Siphonobacter TaxID=2635712 RepID=UPI000CAFEE47|nr:MULTISPECIES: pyridoxamine 5'-phosphate oxidase family protein [unclassified Siphonobacter]MDQ1088232.1 general stress protein 26 [Siphonobacter sp. SORGH_AS_1065]MDR6194377.1 general stress protein 26 [Siphonobacter sp. SORGH_AS_0500]PKK37677.1 hypothetical protein BWI96_04195 [Siphonobacter sp. SORGH_AS_0500]
MAEVKELSQSEQIALLKDKIKEVKVAMLTTFNDEEGLRSRPMATTEMEEDGTLWFFTKEHSRKTDEVEQDHRVSVSYADPNSNTYVSVQGRAKVVTDKAKLEELYSPVLKAWFPDGIDDPELALLKVNVEEAEFWDSSSNKLVNGFRMLKAAITGTKFESGQHGTVTL